jgi:hypothetical protein
MAIVQHRRGTAADLAALNPLLQEGELLVELDCFRFKIGDGVRRWNALPYLNAGDCAGNSSSSSSSSSRSSSSSSSSSRSSSSSSSSATV